MDDLGYSDISARGSEFTTPNLDSLYSNSIIIDNHYIGLVCSPSRSQIITGRYAWNMGVSEMHAFGFYEIASIPGALPTLGDLLQEYSEYKTYYTGKWHMGFSTNDHCPLQRGFEKFYGFYTSNIAYSTKRITFPGMDEGYIDWRAMDEIDYDTQYDYSTYVTGDKLLDVINSHMDDDSINNKPFYIHVPFQGVHWEVENVDSDNMANCDIITTAYDISHTSEDGLMSINNLYTNYDDFEKDKQEFEELKESLGDLLYIDDMSDDGVDTTDYTDGDYYTNRVKMCQNILAFDQVLGDLIDNLKNTNDIWDNTLIIFTSDNGGQYAYGGCNYPLRGIKESFFEGGIRTMAFLAGGYIENKLDTSSTTENEKEKGETKTVPKTFPKEEKQKGIMVKKDSDSDSSVQVTRSGFMHGVDWTPTILGFAGIDVDTVSKNLQSKLYTSVAKKASLKDHKTEEFYEEYLMETSFDGNDLSQWLLTGNNKLNPRISEGHIPLSINAFNKNEITNGEGIPEYSSSILFTSKKTNHLYKLIYLNSELKHSSKKAHYCTYRTLTVTDTNDDVSQGQDSDDSSSATTEILQRTQTVGMFITTNSFLFDLTLDESESTNLLEVLSSNVNVEEEEEEEENSGSNMYKIDELDDYTSNIVSSIWEEGFDVIETEYMNDNPMFNDYLKCLFTDFTDDADPSNFNNAFTPFYSWNEYTSTFDDICASKVNSLLSVMFKSKYSDYS